MFHLLIADKFPENKLALAQNMGIEVTYIPEASSETLRALLQGKHALFVRSTEVTATSLENADDLMLIVRVGSGYNNIDVDEASKRGIYVANCPGKNAIAVAELTIGLLLAVDRQIPKASQFLQAGRWEKKRFSKADGLKGKSFGIAGWGQIGQAVAKRAAAFDMEILAWSRSLTPRLAAKAGIGYCASVEELCQRSDVLSVHLPQTEETKGLFNDRLFQQMKRGAIFINTSRGGLHDQEALLRAMNERDLRVGLDVFFREPEAAEAEYNHPILHHERFVGTPHIGASTEQAQLSVANAALRILGTFLQEGVVLDCVNLRPDAPVPCHLSIRHYNKVGVLAQIMNILSRAGINIETMSNTIFRGGHTAVAQMQLNRTPSDEILQEIESMTETIIQASIRTGHKLSTPQEE